MYKPFISVVFICKRRLPLAKLVLHRFMELVNFPFEMILSYNDTDQNYIDQLREIYDFDHIVKGTKFGFELIQEAYELCSGDYYMHLEDDFYWENPDAVENAVWVLENMPAISFVMMGLLPFHERDFVKIVDVNNDKFGIFRLRKDGGPAYQFNFNPHVRRDKIPIEYGFIDTEKYFELNKGGWIQPERWMSDEWDKEEKLSGCLLGKNFRHLGLYNTGGHKKFWYADKFFLERGSPREFDPIEEFNRFCDNAQYQELFARYIKENEK